jgi:hypothetical protein
VTGLLIRFGRGLNGETHGATLVMTMAKISISLDDDLYRRVRDDAGPDGVSGWLAAAAAARLRANVLRDVAREIAQATGGPYTEHELSKAREWLPSSSTPAR